MVFEGKSFSKLDEKIDKLKDRIKGAEDLKVSEDVLDRFTLLALYDLARKGYIDVLHGVIKTGKESNVFLAKDDSGGSYAVKIHRILTSDFGVMKNYIEGDYRFKKVKKSRRGIILTWVEKEYKNLKTAYGSGASVPRPVAFKKNVLIMDFIGTGREPAPMLKDAQDEKKTVYKSVLKDARKLYEADLIHGDLSEYNILVKNKKSYIIDFSQGVPRDHHLAEELLIRDVGNLSRFFGKSFNEVYRSVTGSKPKTK